MYMVTRIIVACVIIFFAAASANAEEKKRAAAIFLPAQELSDLYCDELGVNTLAEWQKIHPKPKNGAALAAWKKDFKAIKLTAGKAEKSCGKNDQFALEAGENLIAALSRLSEFELMGSDEVLNVARKRLAGRPLIACFTDTACIDAIANDLRASIVMIGELTQHGSERTLVLRRFESTDRLRFEETKKSRKALTADAPLNKVFDEFYELVDDLFANPRFSVSVKLEKSALKEIESGQRIEVGDASTWKVTVEGRRCKGIKLGEKEVTDKAVFVIENESSFVGRDLKFSCTSETLRTAEFTFSIALPTSKKEVVAEAPKQKRDPACSELDSQFKQYRDHKGVSFALEHADKELKGSRQQCMRDGKLMLQLARAAYDQSKDDPFALSRAVEYYIALNGVVDTLENGDREKVAKQVKYFVENFDPYTLYPEKSVWENPGRLVIQYEGLINPGRKASVIAARKYFALHDREVVLPFSQQLYFPKVGNGQTISINGKAIQPAPVGMVAVVNVPPAPPMLIESLDKEFGVKSKPIGFAYSAAIAGAGGSGNAEGMYSRLDLSASYPLALSRFTVSPRATFGATNAFGGVAAGAEERWMHVGGGGLLEWPNTSRFRACAGVDVLYAFDRGFELDPEVGLVMDLSEGLTFGAAWLRPLTFWEDARIAGVGLGLVRIGWSPQ